MKGVRVLHEAMQAHLDARNAHTSKQEGGHASQHALRDGREERPHLYTMHAVKRTAAPLHSCLMPGHAMFAGMLCNCAELADKQTCFACAGFGINSIAQS